MRRHATAVLFAIASLGVAGSLVAQPDAREFEVLAYAQDAFQLTAAETSIERPIIIDSTSSFSVKVWAASQTLTVRISGPDGRQYTVGDAATADAETAFIPINASPNPGGTYLINVDNDPPAGTWTLHVSESEELTDPLDVVAMTTLDNSRWLVLTGGGDDYPAGTDIRLALAAFDGTEKVPSLSIQASVFDPADSTFVPMIADFRDDGTGADEQAGDGIFEAFINPGRAGNFQVQVDATATTATLSFRRTAATTLRVVPRHATILGFTDHGVDDDGDGLFDRIGITPAANIVEPGTYLVYVRLHASNGHELQHTMQQAFAIGPASPELFFSADEIKKTLGVNGPYEVAEVRYFESVGTDLVPADIRYNLGTTAAYSISQLQHAKLEMTTFNAVGDDWDGDGLFDTLDSVITVNVTEAGWYSYSAVLADANGHEIDYQGDISFMQPGPFEMTLYFEGRKIRTANINGPYRLLNLIVAGDDYGIMDREGFTTGPFLASQFNGYPQPHDLNATPTSNESVTLTWQSEPIIIPGSFEIWRNDGVSATLAPLPNAYTRSLSYVDESAVPGKAYVYAIRAKDLEHTSGFSNRDLAVTTSFSDPDLAGQPIKLAHLTELRHAIDLLRAVAGAGDYSWSDISAPDLPISAALVNELKTALADVWTPLGMSAYAPPDVSPGMPIEAARFTTLRSLLK